MLGAATTARSAIRVHHVASPASGGHCRLLRTSLRRLSTEPPAGSPRMTANFPPRPVGADPPRPAKRASKLKWTLLSTLVGGVAYYGAACYASSDSEFEKTFVDYAPGGDHVVNTIRKRDGNYLFALVDLGEETYAGAKHWYDRAEARLEELLGDPKPLSSDQKAAGGLEPIKTPEPAPPTPSPQTDLAPKPVTDRPPSSTDQLNGQKPQAELPKPSVPVETPKEPEASPKQPAAPPKGPAKKPTPTASPATPAEPLLSAHKTNPLDTIQLHYEIPVSESASPIVMDLSRSIGQLVDIINTQTGGLSSQESRDAVLAVSEELAKLETQLATLKTSNSEERLASLAEQNERFQDLLAQSQRVVQESLSEQAEEYRHKLAAEKQLWRDTYQRTLQDTLDEQRGFLYRQFNRLVRFRVDQERGGRLAQMDRITALLRELEQVSRANADILREQGQATRINQALLAVRQTVDHTPHQTAFDTEFQALCKLTRQAQDSYPASAAALATVDARVADQGIETLVDLQQRFDNVRSQVRQVALVPEDGGMLSHVMAWALSKVMFAKQGLVAGQDVEAILSRTEHYLQQADLDSATRELNQLTGWSKRVSQGWVEAARQHLTLKQALQVVETELMMNHINLA
ncbi:hypothetical protein H4R35_001811 [Dimargaris xerosporica]|nr:hypothetical protein H4R35_001811 [Dimargaris xerosporica]